MRVQIKRWTLPALAAIGGAWAVAGYATTPLAAAKSRCPQSIKTGVTAHTIHIGTSFSLSGAVNGNGALDGMRAYFAYVNSQGGVQTQEGKRKIVFTALNDSYVPSQTLQNVKTLVNSDHVFALVGVLGTSNNVAIRPVVQSDCVPSVLATTGDPAIGADPKYSWEAALGLPPLSADAQAIGNYVKLHMPKARIAVLAEDDEIGGSMLQALRQELAGSHAKIVAVQSFETSDPTVSSQMTTLAASKANVFLQLAAEGPWQLQALQDVVTDGWKPALKYEANWEPEQFLSLTASEDNGLFYDLPTIDPASGSNAESRLYLRWWKKQPEAGKFVPSAGVNDWDIAQAFVAMLQKATALTRPALLAAARDFTLPRPNLLVPGVEFYTAPGKPYPFTAVAQWRWNAGTKTSKLVRVYDANVHYEPVPSSVR